MNFYLFGFILINLQISKVHYVPLNLATNNIYNYMKSEENRNIKIKTCMGYNTSIRLVK